MIHRNKRFLRSIKIPYEYFPWSMLHCMVLIILSIACWMSCLVRNPYCESNRKSYLAINLLSLNRQKRNWAIVSCLRGIISLKSWTYFSKFWFVWINPTRGQKPERRRKSLRPNLVLFFRLAWLWGKEDDRSRSSLISNNLDVIVVFFYLIELLLSVYFDRSYICQYHHLGKDNFFLLLLRLLSLLLSNV